MGRVVIHGRFAAAPEWLVKGGFNLRSIQVWLILYLEAFNEGTNSLAITHEEIADVARCSVSSVQRALKELEEFGALEVVNVNSWRGQRANEYHLTTVPGVFDLTEPGWSSVTDRVQSSVTDPSLKESKRTYARDLVFEALCEESGVDWNHSNDLELGPIRKAGKMLRGMNPVPTPEEVHGRAAKYKSEWSHLTFTAMGLVKNWSQFAPTPATPVVVKEPKMPIAPDTAQLAYNLADNGDPWVHPRTGIRYPASEHPKHFFEIDGSDLVIE